MQYCERIYFIFIFCIFRSMIKEKLINACCCCYEISIWWIGVMKYIWWETTKTYWAIVPVVKIPGVKAIYLSCHLSLSHKLLFVSRPWRITADRFCGTIRSWGDTVSPWLQVVVCQFILSDAHLVTGVRCYSLVVGVSCYKPIETKSKLQVNYSPIENSKKLTYF